MAMSQMKVVLDRDTSVCETEVRRKAARLWNCQQTSMTGIQEAKEEYLSR